MMDARFGLRQLRRSPLTTAIAIATLAVGIGLNTAMFSVVHAGPPETFVPGGRSPRVGGAVTTNTSGRTPGRREPTIWSGSNKPRAFEAMSAYGTQDLALEAGEQATQERVAAIAGDFWSITGVQPALGTLFAETEQQSIVLSYELFERRFGARASAVGQTAIVSGYPFTVTGVLPREFRATFPQQIGPGDERREIDAFIALPGGYEIPGAPIPPARRPAPPWVSVVAVLRPGVPIELAQTEMDALHARLQREFPRPPMLQRSIRVLPLGDKLVEHARLALLVMSGAVGFVLLIAAVNVANLLLAQASTRARKRRSAWRLEQGAPG